MPTLQPSPDRAMRRPRILALPLFHADSPVHQDVPIIPNRGDSLGPNSVPINGDVAELNIHDIQNFALAYLRNEYSSNPLDHGPLRPNNTAYVDGARVLSNGRTASPFEPLGRTMPPAPARWMSIGRALRQYDLLPATTPTPTTAAALARRQPFADAARLRALLAAARVPLAAVEQLEAAVKDFSRLNRFSRVRTKLARASGGGSGDAALAALAARLLNDHALLAALWPPRAAGVAMPAHPAERARRAVQRAAAAAFVRVASVDDFEPRHRRGRRWLSLLKPRLPGGGGGGDGAKALRALRVDGQRLDAYRIAENPREAPCWGHTHREYVAVDDLLDVGRGERLVRKVEFTRECSDCGVRHRHEVQLVVGPGEEMPREGELPSYQELEMEQEQLEEIRELYAEAEAQAATEAGSESGSSGAELELDDETGSEQTGSESEDSEEDELPRPRPVVMRRM
ncbi:hypothetical protein SLS58_003932 [Diplodia intermedia]|uniref:Uncharacterized protein n=1 Tax=Diplodia intermedia TaxID=856260 RepID=A0ABR3TV49_9PEZI